MPKAGVARQAALKALARQGSREELLFGIGAVEIRLVHRLMAALA